MLLGMLCNKPNTCTAMSVLITTRDAAFSEYTHNSQLDLLNFVLAYFQLSKDYKLHK